MTHILFEHTDDGITIARAEAPTAWASLAPRRRSAIQDRPRVRLRPVCGHRRLLLLGGPRPRRGRGDGPSRRVLSQ